MASVPDGSLDDVHTSTPAAVLRHAMGWALLGSVLLWVGVLVAAGVIGRS